MQNGDINRRIQVIEESEKDIPFISIDSLQQFLLIFNRYIKKIDISKVSILKWMIRYDTIRYISIEMIYRYFPYTDPSLVKTV